MTEGLSLSTRSQFEFQDITAMVKRIAADSGIQDGLVTVYCPHTTAAITINEAADPAVVKDMIKELDEIVPLRHGYSHGEGNSAAHIKSSMIGCSETVILTDGRLLLGTWQGIYFCEFDGPRQRKVHVSVISA